MWPDGIFKTDSFYAESTEAFGADNTTAWDDIMVQYDLIESHCRNTARNPLIHGYADAKDTVWADPVTGCGVTPLGPAGPSGGTTTH